MASPIIMRGVSETYVWWYGDSIVIMTRIQECAPFILRRDLAYIAAHSLLEGSTCVSLSTIVITSLIEG